MSRPRLLADYDLNEHIVHGVLRREPAIEFIRTRDGGLNEHQDAEVLELCDTRDVRGKPMPKIAEETCLPVDINAQPLVQAAAALQPVIRGYHEEIEREQRLPKALVEQLHAAGFYRMVIPCELGGLQADPLTYLRVVELLAEGAGSVGWNVANHGVGQLHPLRLPDQAVHALYAPGA